MRLSGQPWQSVSANALPPKNEAVPESSAIRSRNLHQGGSAQPCATALEQLGSSKGPPLSGQMMLAALPVFALRSWADDTHLTRTFSFSPLPNSVPNPGHQTEKQSLLYGNRSEYGHPRGTKREVSTA